MPGTVDTVSVPVSNDDVYRHVEHFGARATLITVGDDLAPHPVSVIVERLDGVDHTDLSVPGDAADTELPSPARFTARSGNRTRANVVARPRCTLLWQAPAGEQYALILDGDASVNDDGVTVAVSHGILHRIAEVEPASGQDSAPTCVPLGNGD